MTGIKRTQEINIMTTVIGSPQRCFEVVGSPTCCLTHAVSEINLILSLSK
jgi:hypothetical protein